jgi:hypothetical protein
MTNEKYEAWSVIYLKDNGDPEMMLICCGTKDEYVRTSELIHGVTYSGDRPVDSAEMIIVPEGYFKEEDSGS